MRLVFRILLNAAMLSLGFSQAARADEASAAYVVTYLEAMPSSTDKSLALLRQFAKASRKDEGNLQFEVLQRNNQPNHFAILEVWKDQKAQGTHAAAAHTKQFRENLQPLLRSPYDERPHTGLAVRAAPGAGGAKNTAVYAVTHVDIIPTRKDDGIAMVKELTEASRKDKGNLRFDALQQSSRPNHMTVVETWTDKKALDAHGVAAHTKQFREKLLPLSGSLYDERLYKVLN